MPYIKKRNFTNVIISLNESEIKYLSSSVTNLAQLVKNPAIPMIKFSLYDIYFQIISLYFPFSRMLSEVF